MKTIQEHVEAKFGIQFENTKILDQAFYHSSYVNEHRNLDIENNERLEFLGDAVLELIISDYLYGKYPSRPEGKLSKLRSSIVREESLSEYTKRCGFDAFLRLGRGEEATGGRERPSILCDLFESFLGALRLDKGVDAARNFIHEVIIPDIDAGKFEQEMDFKTKLQEKLQTQGSVSIQYVLVSEEGPSHAKVFDVEAYVDGKKIGVGKGKSKKIAEQDAARNALRQL
ncbi:MAG: ribonuclease III [Streptococcaceae bacterium]|jgi:ribonuclease-3|nr:ribonuclease III [Streptococcaceae bacterium]